MLYRLLYNSRLNKFYRNLIKRLAPNWEWKKKIPVSGTIRLETEEGPLYVETNPTSFATKHIFWDGLDNFEYIPIFKKLIPKVENFIDVGANTGIYCTLGCLYNKDLKVLAFEPSSGPFEYLKRNIRKNEMAHQITPYKIAASSVSGKAEFYEVANNKYHFLDHNLGGVGNLESKISHRKMTINVVATEKLDQILKNKHSDFIPQLVKIDTEATEHIVLAGMTEIIDKFRPLIICETLYNRIEDKIEDSFIGKNYLFFNHLQSQQKLVPVPSIRRANDNAIRDCFIVPAEKKYLVEEFL